MMKKNFLQKDDGSNYKSLQYSFVQLHRLRKLHKKRFSVVKKIADLNDTSSYLLSMFAIGLHSGKTIAAD